MESKIAKSLNSASFSYYSINSNRKMVSDKIIIKGLQDDHIFKFIHKKKIFYEYDLLFHLSKILTPENKVAIDVGANIGNHSIFFGKYLCNKVIAIEPSKTNSDILQTNLNNNLNTSEFEFFKLAVGNKTGTVSLIYPNENNLGMAKVDESISEEEAVAEQVEIDKLDNIIQNNNKIGLIKIDVEGLEFDVLKGAKQIIKLNLPHIVVEAHTDEKLDEIKNYLKQFNYTILGKFCKTPTYHFINPNHYKNLKKPFFLSLKYYILNLLNKYFKIK